MARSRRTVVIVTTYGADGAASAALGVRHWPGARLVVASSSRVAEALERIARERPGAAVHVCGVGTGEHLEVTVAALQALRESKCAVTWYCGRGYLDDDRPALETHCTCAFLDAPSNAAALAQTVGSTEDRRSSLLLELAREFVQREDDLDEEHQWWHDLVESTAARSFKYADELAYPACIRKLADLEDVTPLDREEVARWREGASKAMPLGRSEAMNKLRTLIARLGPVDEPVLVLGPSGAGKEMVARLLHEASARIGGPFIPVNCAILSTSADLASDRLFGHEAGAYTGATQAQAGAFELADDGTLFLDEVAEIPLPVQTQLLRVLEEKQVLPLGSMKPRPVNVRIVAATNRDLPAMVGEGTFRLDLYHRLNVLVVRVPGLAERPGDIRSIARTVQRVLVAEGYGLTISRPEYDAMASYPWPGNVRQLINILKRAAYMKISILEALREESDLAAGVDGSIFKPGTLEAACPEAEIRRAYMRHVYELAEKNWSRAAHVLDLSVNTLRKWLDAENS